MPRVKPEHLAARRMQILDAAEHCFSKAGFHRTTMADIIAESGLSTGAIYNYFKSKDEIIAAIACERHVLEQEKIVELITNNHIGEALSVLVRAFSSELSSDDGVRRRRVGVFAWAEALLDEQVTVAMRQGVDGPRQQIAKLVETANASRSTPLDPDATARTFIAIYHGFVLQMLWDKETPHEAMLEVVEEIIHSLWSSP